MSRFLKIFAVLVLGLTGASVAPLTATAGSAAVGAAAACRYDDSGTKRVQAIYVRSTSDADRYAEMAPKIDSMAKSVSFAVDTSAIRTGGARRVRFVLNADCSVNVANVALPSPVDINNDRAVADSLKARGYDSTDRKFVVFAQTGAYCGNTFDGTFTTGPSWAMLGSGCWEWNAAGHELLHALGAVSPNAPHGTPGSHCWDDPDIMCYDDDDKPNTYPLQDLCPKSVEDDSVDCNNDDYFNTDPAAGTWLANHPNNNVATSPFLTTNGDGPVYTGSKTIATARAGANAYVTKYQRFDGNWAAKAKIVTTTSSPFYSAVLAVRTASGVRYIPPAGVPRGTAAYVTVELNDSVEFKLCEGNAAAKSGCTATWW
ncbi:hypothetical protein [Amycolatopsis solani]|uniref:hypothetical protein n=1 Tax=Amycolatopsis solani TaxID=3028615 RepID=UPI0025B112D0|nr:hypothetical protein [Amycolatopsis sp. MEP2-6]